MKKAYQITAAGRVELEAELAELKSRRGDIADKIAKRASQVKFKLAVKLK